MKIFYLITGNLDKVSEAERSLGEKINHIKLDLDEIQELDPIKISEHKAKQAWEKIQKPLVVWDTAININCLNGFPGPLIKWFWTQVTLEKICQIAKALGDNKISTSLLLTYTDGKIIKHFEGKAFGIIPEEPRGDKGFGWDPIFIPEGSDKTFAQMEESDPLFHTMNIEAFKGLKEFLMEDSDS